ncbi:MAG TPA: hypothetical protein VKE30_08850 [Chthoniobacterales bacterium]|nr:hypothetical protein [Chthoniobacterales bacterium]
MLPTEFHQIHPAFSLWHAFDPGSKVDLFSSALKTAKGLCIVDPIPLPEADLAELSSAATIVGVIVTNANHHRSCADYSERFCVPIFAHTRTFPDSKPRRFAVLNSGALIGGDLEVIEIEGAVSGEIVLYLPSNGGTVLVGDALVNFEPYGFTFLPRKYCLNEKQMRKSLYQLLARPAERMLFAHGTPILSGASTRLRQLLDADA